MIKNTKQCSTKAAVAAALLSLPAAAEAVSAPEHDVEADVSMEQEVSSLDILFDALTEDKYRRIEKLDAGLIDFEDLTQEEREDNDFMIIALEDSVQKYEALKNLKSTHISHPDVQRLIVQNVGLLAFDDDMSCVWEVILSTEEGLSELFPKMMEGLKDMPSSMRPIGSILSEYTPEEHVEEVLRIYRDQCRELILSDNYETLSDLPDFIFHEPETCRRFVEVRRGQGDLLSSSELAQLGLSEAQITRYYTDILKHPEVDREQFVFYVTDDFLLYQCKDLYLSLLGDNQRVAIGRLTEELLKDSDIKEAAANAVMTNPLLLSALHKSSDRGLGVEHPFSVSIKETILSDKNLLDRVVNAFLSDKRASHHLDDEYLRHPYVSYNIRLAINKEVAYGNQGIELPHPFVDKRAYKLFPEYIRLAEQTDPDIPLSLYRYNPARLIERIKRAVGSQMPVAELQQLLQLKKAGDALGINEFGRFDNGYELIRNRYVAAPTHIQEILRDALGDDYFSDPIVDDRPLCVIVNPAHNKDHNGAFLSRENAMHFLDMVDLLTSHYQVIYFEATDESSTVQGIIDACQAFGKKTEMLILGGHGNNSGISLGNGRSIFDQKSGQIDTSDKALLRILGESVAEDGVIILESCSTGAEVDGTEENIASVIHRAIPHAHLYAPMSDAAAYFNFREDGALSGIEYLRARKLHYAPDGSLEKESSLYSFLTDVKDASRYTWFRIQSNPLKFATIFFSTVGVISFFSPLGRRIGKVVTSTKNALLSRRQKKQKQLKLFETE